MRIYTRLYLDKFLKTAFFKQTLHGIFHHVPRNLRTNLQRRIRIPAKKWRVPLVGILDHVGKVQLWTSEQFPPGCL